MDADATIRSHAARTRHRIPTTILPYWLEVSRDERAGGYLLHDDVVRSPVRRVGRVVVRGRRPRPGDDKQLVTQARLLWVFSFAHRQGLGAGTEYLDAATSGYRFLLDHFRDPVHGGYGWMTNRTGRPVNEVKHLYGQAFVVYGLVQYARATGDERPRQHALELFRTIETELHDDDHGGWREHGDRDWRALAPDDPRVAVAYVGRKSGNAVVHWLEALTDLAADTGDDQVRASLAEALEVSRCHLFPADPGRTREPCLPDWTPDPEREHLASYGHSVEYVWLMLRAQQVLGVEPDRERFHAYLDHTLRHGFDHRRGGAFTAGHGDEPAHHRYKTAWVQCELINALTDALAMGDDERYRRALAQTLDFVERHMTDRRDGILLESVQEDGGRRWPRKSGDWKAGYHDVRAAARLAEAFSP